MVTDNLGEIRKVDIKDEICMGRQVSNISGVTMYTKVIDGRRVYTMKRDFIKSDVITLQINKYKNIWADHKRNDLKKIEFFIEDEFLPYEILIHFKERVFKLERI